MKAWLSMVGTAFLGGAIAWASTHVGDGIPSTQAQWKAAGVGILVAGASAVWHRFQPPPGSTSGPSKTPPETPAAKVQS